MGKGKKLKGTPLAWHFELTPNNGASETDTGRRKPGRTWEAGGQNMLDATPLDEDTLCALAPGVPRARVRALAAISGSDVQGLVDRLLNISASLGDSAVPSSAIGACAHPPSASHWEGLSFADGTTFFSQIPSELLGPLLASLPLDALGRFFLTCREAYALASAYLRNELVSVVPRQVTRKRRLPTFLMKSRIPPISFLHVHASIITLRGSPLVLNMPRPIFGAFSHYTWLTP